MFPRHMGRGGARTYPPGIFPTHPLRTLGFVALGSILGELDSCNYMGLTCW